MMSVNPSHLAEAYLQVARADHYLVGVVPGYTLDELDAAEQILISIENASRIADPAIGLALDLIEYDRKRVMHR